MYKCDINCAKYKFTTTSFKTKHNFSVLCIHNITQTKRENTFNLCHCDYAYELSNWNFFFLLQCSNKRCLLNLFDEKRT